MIPRHVEVIYCDDIRHEVSNKLSFVGVYTGDLLAPQFPYTVPKLCLYISVLTPAEKPFQRLKLRVFKDEESLLEAEGPKELTAVPERGPDTGNPQERLFAAHFELHAANLLLAAPCNIRVRVETESEELRARALRVALAPTAPTQQ